MSTRRGRLALVLHAHLPFVHHPEWARFYEEIWLYEAIAETYLPLLRMMDGLERDGVDFRLTMSVTPPLCEMLSSPLLRSRFEARLDAMRHAADVEVSRHLDGDLAEATRFYVEELASIGETWRRWDGQIIHGLAHHEGRGTLEIMTCGATDRKSVV